MTSLSIRTRILLFLLGSGSALLLIGIAVFAAIQGAEYRLNRVGWAHKQLEAITELDVYSNRYSEQIAERLLARRRARTSKTRVRNSARASTSWSRRRERRSPS